MSNNPKEQCVQLFGSAASASTIGVQTAGASLAVGSYSRSFQGPLGTGRYSIHSIPSGTFTGTYRVFYSNIPLADPDVASHWVEDVAPGVGVVTLTSGTSDFRSVGNICPAWVRVQVTVATGTLVLAQWARSEVI